jgi:hypothetical protein
MEDVPEVINLKLRDEYVQIHRKELEELGSTDWFLKNLIKYPSNKKDETNCYYIYELWEDKKTVMSIFDSLRFNSLIIYPNVSFDYLILLCDKWTVPPELIENIIERKKELNKPTKSKIDKEDIILQCTNCKVGFKLSENYNQSCKIHSLGTINDKWLCCQKPLDHPHCKVGYHVAFNMVTIMQQYYKMIKEIEE